MKIEAVLGTVVLCGALAGVAACSNPSGKSWAITYEVTGQNAGTLANVGYADSPNRYNDEIKQQTVQGPVGVPWKQDVVVTAGQKAEITATPTGDLTLTCRILLDAQKELARATAPGPGKPVSCAKTTDS
ncbi:MmpS family transport accessory protein [Amycolatopsis sp. RTGN1]|uniref:MmpS family transport accessory protein n=1 Tax=Amycolatopsis ponsaeliensis TaxID=2992142 RepID=UPI00254A6D74|nr:MmpS family transport accessory protein [Amycolatopsis sp. RTGN1]